MEAYQAYLNQVAYECRDLDDSQRADLLAELQTHIEAALAEAPPTLSAEAQQQKILQELGSPKDLAHNLHKSSWKRQWTYFAWAILPLISLNFINNALYQSFSQTNHPASFARVITLALYFLMLFIAYRLKSKLLIGWWFGLVVVGISEIMWYVAAWEQPILGISNPFWFYAALLIWGLTLWRYGRFLWHNRTDGFILSLTLLPYVWAYAYTVMTQTMIPNDYLFRQLLTATVSGLALGLTVLAAFIIPDRQQRWLGIFMGASIYFIGAMVIWRGTHTAFLWLLLYLPLFAGLGLEYALRRTWSHPTLPQPDVKL